MGLAPIASLKKPLTLQKNLVFDRSGSIALILRVEITSFSRDEDDEQKRTR